MASPGASGDRFTPIPAMIGISSGVAQACSRRKMVELQSEIAAQTIVDRVADSQVYLREMTRSDVDQMAEWPLFREPDLRWANLDLYGYRERDAYFERNRSNASRRRFVVLDRRDRVVGTIGLRNLNYLAEEGTLGIIIRADEVGCGFGGDAIRNLLHYGFGTLCLRRVVLDVAESNLRARRCYERIGFYRTGQHVGPGGARYVDMVIYRRTFELVERSLNRG
jgi:RimJ/RimL family protein N-acetyltransferase